jgi:Asp-tRNA(Asn)/Glu-tRNA(Gln) amidotransferase A subunit family amidase
MYGDIASLFERFDAIVCPAVGITGLTAGDSFLAELPVVDGERLESLSDINLTRPFNVLNRLPAISVPSGHIAASGLPLGVQIVGRPYDEQTVLALAEAIEGLVGRMDHGLAMADSIKEA